MPVGPRRRNTPQRQTILRELRESHAHPTAAEIYVAVRERLPRISLGTVYRNLDVLHADGLIHRIETAGGEARYDGRVDDHGHVRCRACGLLRDLPGGAPAPRGGPAPGDDIQGVTVDGYRLEYTGVCSTCRENGWMPAAAPDPR
jgi:Fur family ferric uptake transcriptional regulator